jgi:hypothetical protein
LRQQTERHFQSVLPRQAGQLPEMIWSDRDSRKRQPSLRNSAAG